MRISAPPFQLRIAALDPRFNQRGNKRARFSARELTITFPDICEVCRMPPMLHALENFVEIMAEDGRLAEIGNPPRRVETYST